eukprot:2481569-Rhodomonas_salina.1
MKLRMTAAGGHSLEDSSWRERLRERESTRAGELSLPRFCSSLRLQGKAGVEGSGEGAYGLHSPTPIGPEGRVQIQDEDAMMMNSARLTRRLRRQSYWYNPATSDTAEIMITRKLDTPTVSLGVRKSESELA